MPKSDAPSWYIDMTAQTPTTLKTAFENGDTPQGSDFANLIDSSINVATSAEQAIDSNLKTTKELIAARVSADSIGVSSLTVTGTVAFTNLALTNGLSVVGTAAFAAVNASGAAVFDGAATFNSAANFNGAATLNGAVTFNSAATFNSSPIVNSLEASTSAGGSNQATATLLNGAYFSIIRAGTSAQGVSLPTFAVTGQQKAVYNTVTANEVKIYPPTSAQINNLGLNTAFILSADRSVQFFYEKNSRIWIIGAF